MLKHNFKNIILFFFLKYLLLYIFLMFKNNDYTLIELNSLRNGEDIFYYLWLFLFLPVVCSILFSAPIYFTFKARNGFVFMLLLCAILVVEYFLYTYYASQTDLMNGVYNAVISLLLLLLLFFSRINSLFSRAKQTKATQ
jgi:Na+/H+ antiporter NhaC